MFPTTCNIDYKTLKIDCRRNRNDLVLSSTNTFFLKE